jgi:hypothetical protein
MRKKNNSSRQEQGSQELKNIQEKLTKSSALNGGFDTLLYKIDKIEENQGNLSNKLDKIHDAIYDPDEGLFSRMNAGKAENEKKFNEITAKITELKVEQSQLLESDVDQTQKITTNSDKLSRIDKSVSDLVQNKDSISGFFKWFFAALGGGIITLIVKYIETKFR